MSNKALSIYAEALKRQKRENKQVDTATATSKSTREPTRTITYPRVVSRDNAREESVTHPRDSSRKTPRKVNKVLVHTLPTRDEIQGFSFRLRDELRVKVQAEVPPAWQKELDEIASTLNVKKLELYRYIIGEFLGKVKRKRTT